MAETNDAAETGAALVAVSYEDLPAVTDPREALAADAPLVHETRGTNLLTCASRSAKVMSRPGLPRRMWSSTASLLPPGRSMPSCNRRRASPGSMRRPCRRRDRWAVAARGPQADRADAGIAGGTGRDPLRGHRRGVRGAGRSIRTAFARPRRLEAEAACRHRLEPRGIDPRPPQAAPVPHHVPLGRDAGGQDHRGAGRLAGGWRRLRLHQRGGDEGGDALRLRCLPRAECRRRGHGGLHQQYPFRARSAGSVRRRPSSPPKS